MVRQVVQISAFVSEPCRAVVPYWAAQNALASEGWVLPASQGRAAVSVQPSPGIPAAAVSAMASWKTSSLSKKLGALPQRVTSPLLPQ